jgi:hypothetical protein
MAGVNIAVHPIHLGPWGDGTFHHGRRGNPASSTLECAGRVNRLAVANLSRRYRLDFQQPLLIEYAGDDHCQRGTMTAQKFSSYFPVGYGELSS